MSTKIEFLPGDLAAAVFALANNRINFYVPSAYEVGMGNASRRATVSAETLAYFKDRLSFSVSRQDADRQLARLLTLASDYLAHLSAPISLWARESMNKLPQTRYKAVRRNCGLLVEILSTLAFHRRNTNLIVAQLDLTFMYREMFGLKVSRDACKTALIKLAEAELITLKLGEKNGYASKVKLLTSVDHLASALH
ncbi:hypothetical protein [Micromonospora sp. RV43]|uniref:hypothetical protein n=1 Tax=Micromonospora sp. RV43 TaxID=1661387 RepID=UPI000AE9160B|nr:hypothetical protein [Micromonospora sp. RV43]